MEKTTTAHKKNSLEPTAEARRRLPPLLRTAWFGLNQVFRRRIAHLAITPDQYTILRWLHENKDCGLTQRQLTRLMTSDPNTITAVLRRMEAAGVISRQAHPDDRRANCIRITRTGEQIFKQAKKVAQKLQEDVLSVIAPSRREKFLTDLEAVAAAVMKEK